MNNYSPNMLKTFDECQQKFFFKYIQKLSVPQPSAMFEKGKKIHALANYFLRGENIEKMEKTLNTDEKIAWEKLKSNKYFKLNVVNTEYNLSCKIGKYWVGGRLDALLNGIGGEKEVWKLGSLEAWQDKSQASKPPNLQASNYYILDYKTGNIPKNAEQDFQTIVYLLCADKLLNKKGGYDSLGFVYLGLKSQSTPHPDPHPSRGEGDCQYPESSPNFQPLTQNGANFIVEKEIPLTQELKKQYEDKIIQICEKIDFATNSNVFIKNCENCERCEYKKLCNGE